MRKKPFRVGLVPFRKADGLLFFLPRLPYNKVSIIRCLSVSLLEEPFPGMTTLAP